MVGMCELHCPCRFRLPLQYNDGRTVEPEVLAKILATLGMQFGGYTPLGTTTGYWEGQAEPMQTIEVAVPPSRVPELEAVVKAIGKELGQKYMYFDEAPPTLKLLKVDDDAEASSSS